MKKTQKNLLKHEEQEFLLIIEKLNSIFPFFKIKILILFMNCFSIFKNSKRIVKKLHKQRNA